MLYLNVTLIQVQRTKTKDKNIDKNTKINKALR